MLTITYWDDPLLKKVCEPVPDSAFGPALVEVGRQMLELMTEKKGVGLAANQAGLDQQLFVMTFPRKKDEPKLEPLTVINPIIELSGKVLCDEEGCLSIPGFWDQVQRSENALLRFQQPLDGTWEERALTGMDARIAQHEVDHLNGIMFFDRMSKQMRKALLRRWEKTRG